MDYRNNAHHRRPRFGSLGSSRAGSFASAESFRALLSLVRRFHRIVSYELNYCSCPGSLMISWITKPPLSLDFKTLYSDDSEEHDKYIRIFFWVDGKLSSSKEEKIREARTVFIAHDSDGGKLYPQGRIRRKYCFVHLFNFLHLGLQISDDVEGFFLFMNSENIRNWILTMYKGLQNIFLFFFQSTDFRDREIVAWIHCKKLKSNLQRAEILSSILSQKKIKNKSAKRFQNKLAIQSTYITDVDFQNEWCVPQIAVWQLKTRCRHRWPLSPPKKG